MKYLFTIIAAVLFNAFAFCQSYKKLVEPKVTISYPDHSVTFFVKAMKGTLSSDTEKHYYWYSANHISITQGGYSGKLLHGTYTDYYLNKNLKEKGKFNKGLKKGEWLSWYESGHLKDRYSWNSGKKNGKYSLYDTEGRLKEKGKYRNDLLNGKITVYSEKDSSSYYRNGKAYKPKKIKLKLPKSISPLHWIF
ncbi:toxin-antitoxin system YwqK family antitoxin [Rubrolithibacter danxiaensis]|uniref:toxin-antitoxin system YwqK family antitoxin n=1 Tax=Rubrolithibacter danxiaensis TaxID=3390805 RepID=UPI003BF90D66